MDEEKTYMLPLTRKQAGTLLHVLRHVYRGNENRIKARPDGDMKHKEAVAENRQLDGVILRLSCALSEAKEVKP